MTGEKDPTELRDVDAVAQRDDPGEVDTPEEANRVGLAGAAGSSGLPAVGVLADSDDDERAEADDDLEALRRD
jgi:hypothetical protein